MSGALLPKPQMRGLLVKRTKRILVTGLILGTAFVVSFKMFFMEGRRKIYKEFYNNYDAEKEFEAMKKAGLFQSVKAIENKK